MGVLDRFEKGVENTVASIFSRAFKSELKPVDIISAIQRDMSDRALTLGRGRTVAPNVFHVQLSTLDFETAESWGVEALGAEFADAAEEYARDSGYALVGPVEITFGSTAELERGKISVQSSSRRTEGSPAGGYSSRESNTPGTHATGPSQPMIDVNGERYLLTGPITVIGRGSESDIIVDDTGVSRRHLEIEVTSQGTIARDLGSTNGSFVEGHQIEAATLVSGNTINIGRTQVLYWDSQEAADA